MSKTVELLRSLNPELFSEHQVAEPHAVLISGEKKKGKDGEADKLKFVQTTTRDVPGLGKSLYLRAQFKKAGDLVKIVLANNEERTAFRGSKKAQAGNIFKNVQTNLFNTLTEELRNERFKEAGKDNDQNPMVEADMVVYGKIISVITPSYYPQMVNKESGARTKLTATRFNPETGKYEQNKPVVMNVLRFFADESDLNELLATATKIADSQVMPYLAEKVTTITEKAGSQTVTEKEEKTTPDEELPGDDQEDDPDADV